jgi:hypothetical protein
MIIQVAYTNSNCSDLWEMFIKQNRKHTKIPLFIISDKEIKNYGYDDMFLYSNDKPYYKVWVDALEKFNSEYFIYLQEDFILYDNVNENKINEYVEFLENNTEYSFIRLIKSGQLNDKLLYPTLYEIESANPNIFSMQATIWKTSDYIKIMNSVRDNKWLENENYRKKMIELNMKGSYYYGNEIKRGMNHYDTNIYPYIATALVRGKWNISEYNIELSDILSSYNIDINKRGIL